LVLGSQQADSRNFVQGRPRQMLDLVGGTVSYRQNAPSLNSSANASVLFAAQLAGQEAR